jgi:hypothetical protein
LNAEDNAADRRCHVLPELAYMFVSTDGRTFRAAGVVATR